MADAFINRVAKPGCGGGSARGAEAHIAGLLVYAAADAIAQVADAIRAMPDAEVHGQDATKLVVVVERTSAQEVMAFVEALRDTAGVVNVALVYQHAEDANDMEDTLDVDYA